MTKATSEQFRVFRHRRLMVQLTNVGILFAGFILMVGLLSLSVKGSVPLCHRSGVPAERRIFHPAKNFPAFSLSCRQPGGLTEGSRGLRHPAPAGCRHPRKMRASSRPRRGRRRSGIPSGCGCLETPSGGIAVAQPPAIFWHRSAMQQPHFHFDKDYKKMRCASSRHSSGVPAGRRIFHRAESYPAFS